MDGTADHVIVPVEFTAYTDDRRIAGCIDVPCIAVVGDDGHAFYLPKENGDTVLLRTLLPTSALVTRVVVRPQLVGAAATSFDVRIPIKPGATLAVRIGERGVSGEV